jgi:hypothetical protein
MESPHTTDPTRPTPVCAAHVYADLTPGQHLELVIALHGRGESPHASSSCCPTSPAADAPDWAARVSGNASTPCLQTSKAWTTARLWRAARRPEMSLRTFYRRLREQARWCRPRLIAKGDSDHDTTCADIATRVAALRPDRTCSPRTNPYRPTRSRPILLDATGLRHRILTSGSNVRPTVHGAINLATGAWHHHASVRNVSVVFCYFLHQLLDAYSDAPVVAVICDNGATHHSGIPRRWLTEHPRLMLIEGAKYSPQDNPVERVWAGLKQSIANTAPATMADRIRQTHAYFRRGTS